MTEPTQPDVETDADEEFENIEGVVVDFLSNREVIMSVGKAEGVKVGMRFVILGIEQIDVEVNGQRITGPVEVPKSVVRVVRLSGEHLSIGRTFRTIKGRAAYEYDNPAYVLRNGVANSILGNMSEPTIKVAAIPDRMESFDVSAQETVRGRTNMKVQKGDVVRLTVGDEFL